MKWTPLRAFQLYLDLCHQCFNLTNSQNLKQHYMDFIPIYFNKVTILWIFANRFLINTLSFLSSYRLVFMSQVQVYICILWFPVGVLQTTNCCIFLRSYCETITQFIRYCSYHWCLGFFLVWHCLLLLTCMIQETEI